MKQPYGCVLKNVFSVTEELKTMVFQKITVAE